MDVSDSDGLNMVSYDIGCESAAVCYKMLNYLYLYCDYGE